MEKLLVTTMAEVVDGADELEVEGSVQGYVWNGNRILAVVRAGSVIVAIPLEDLCVIQVQN